MTGRVYGDESYFDALRGGPDTGFCFALDRAPERLSFNRGLTSSRGTAFQRRPAFAADQLDGPSSRRGRLGAMSRARRQPVRRAAADERLVAADVTLIRLTNQPSDNFFAEMLLKGLGTAGGRGTSRGWRRVAARSASWAPRASSWTGPASRAATAPRPAPSFACSPSYRSTTSTPFRDSLGVARRDGTLGGRMRGTAAAGRCRGKTGTLSNVSALSGYCDLSIGSSPSRSS